MPRKTEQKNRVKLLVAIINKEDELKLCEAVNEVSAALHFSGLGNGTAPSSHKSFFGFHEIDKRVTMSLIPADLEHAMLSAIGDGVLKLNQAFEAGNGFIDAEKMRRLTGIE